MIFFTYLRNNEFFYESEGENQKDNFRIIERASLFGVLSVYPNQIDKINGVLKLHSSLRFHSPVDVIATDNVDLSYARFNIRYLFYSNLCNKYAVVNTRVSELDSIYSSEKTHPGLNWAERELWDMFGIPIENHSDLRRILTDYGFSGNPLRKDFPTFGLVEISNYSYRAGQIVFQKSAATADLNLCEPLNVWDNTEGDTDILIDSEVGEEKQD